MTTVERKDVVVVGLGSMGSMALWQLAKRGVNVLGLEQFGQVHTYGAYAGESRLFRVAAKEGQLFTPALMRSRELWQELGTAYGQHPLMPVGALSSGRRSIRTSSRRCAPSSSTTCRTRRSTRPN